MFRFPFLKCLTALAVLAGLSHAAELFRAEFEDAAHSSHWSGNPSEYESGVKGRAVVVRSPDTAAFTKENGFSSEEGTLEFWIKTSWNGNDGHMHRIVSFGRQSGMTIIKSPDNQIQFHWLPGGEARPMKIGFDVSRDWPAGEWRHLVFTWKRGGNYIAYLDSRLAEGGKPEETLARLSQVSPLVLGGPGTKNGVISFDDLVLHDRELSRGEVEASFVRGREALEQVGNARLTVRGLLGSLPATLILDTGSNLNAVSKDHALKAGLELFPSRRADTMIREETDGLLVLGNASSKLRFAVLDSSRWINEAGLLGWMQFFAANRLLVQWEQRTMKPLPSWFTPDTTRGWRSIPIKPGQDQLLQLSPQEFRIGVITFNLPLVIDTGFSGGLSLTEKTWKELLAAHPKAKTTYGLSWTPFSKRVEYRGIIPETTRLFDRDIQGISVTEDRHRSPGFERLRVGLAVLSHFEVVIDGPGSQLLILPRESPAFRENLNLTGLLVYRVKDLKGVSEHSIAEVLKDSPAWLSGLRPGDRILSFDGEGVPDGCFRKDQEKKLVELHAAGKDLRLIVLRDGEKLQLSHSSGPN